MKAYMDYLDSDRPGRLITDCLLGDWLGPENSKNETHFLVTAYHVYDLQSWPKRPDLGVRQRRSSLPGEVRRT